MWLPHSNWHFNCTKNPAGSHCSLWISGIMWDCQDVLILLGLLHSGIVATSTVSSQLGLLMIEWSCKWWQWWRWDAGKWEIADPPLSLRDATTPQPSLVLVVMALFSCPSKRPQAKKPYDGNGDSKRIPKSVAGWWPFFEVCRAFSLKWVFWNFLHKANVFDALTRFQSKKCLPPM